MMTADDNVISITEARKKKQLPRDDGADADRSSPIGRVPSAIARHALLSAKETKQSICQGVKSACFTIGRTIVAGTRFAIHASCNIGIVVCLWYIARDLFNDFPNGALGFAALIVGALAMQCLKLTMNRLIARAPIDSIFFVPSRRKVQS